MGWDAFGLPAELFIGVQKLDNFASHAWVVVNENKFLLNEKNHLAQLQPHTSKDIKLTKNTNPIKDKLKIPASLPFVTQPRHTSFTHQLTMPRRQAIVQARTV